MRRGTWEEVSRGEWKGEKEKGEGGGEGRRRKGEGRGEGKGRERICSAGGRTTAAVMDCLFILLVFCVTEGR